MSDETLNLRVTGDTSQAQQAFSGLTSKMGEFLIKAGSMALVANLVFNALKDLYKAARDGATAVGGDTLKTYEEFDKVLQSIEDDAKGALARGLEPLIAGMVKSATAVDAVEEALRRGQITQQEYNLIALRATQIGWENAAAQGGVTVAYDAAAEAVIALTKAELAHITYQSSSWDKAMLVSAGIIENDFRAQVKEAKGDVGDLKAAWNAFTLALSGPLANSAEDFAKQFDTLADKAISIKEEIAGLGGLAYMTPEQRANILELRNELIGVAMEIRAIDEKIVHPLFH